MKKRFISILVILSIMMAMLPMTVSAGDTDFEIENGVLKKYKGISSTVVVPSDVTTIGNRAFAGNDKIMNVTIPNSVTTIGFAAFADCESLREVNIPNSVTSMGLNVFKGGLYHAAENNRNHRDSCGHCSMGNLYTAQAGGS